MSTPVAMSAFKGVAISPRRVKQTAMDVDEDVGRLALKRRASNFDEDEIEDPSPKRRAIDPALHSDDENTPVTVIPVAKAKPLTGADIARNRFYLYHKAAVQALLPLNSHFFANLEAKMSGTGPADIVPFERIYAQPVLIKNGDMKEYQLEGLSHLVHWHKNNVNGILGDEMGLGKTLQTLALFAYIREHEPENDLPHIIVCPLSVLQNWMDEVKRWLPSFKIIQFHGATKERNELKRQLATQNFQILVTNYECVKAEASWLKSRRWSYIVLDEGHRIKNSDTGVSHALQHWKSQRRLLLSGTAVQNKLLELWGLMHWLHPLVFTDATAARFDQAFQLNKGQYNLGMIEAAQKFLQVIMLRRTKADVELSVPPKEERTVFLPLRYDLQRRCYYILLKGMDMQIDLDDDMDRNAVRDVMHNAISKKLRAAPGQWKKLQNLLMQLRKVCDHPYLMPEIEPDDISSTVIPVSSKFVFLDKLLDEVLPKNERVLIFSQFRDAVHLLEDLCKVKKARAATLHGSVNRVRRALDIRLFQEDDSCYEVFLATTKTGGQGITLTKATHVVLLDSSWNPQDDLQAIARAHRIGQTKTVKVYRLICKESVEDQMLERLQKKLYLSYKLNSGAPETSAKKEYKRPEEQDLITILFFGLGAVRQPSSQERDPKQEYEAFVNSSLDEILAQSEGMEDMRTNLIKQEIGEQVDEGFDERIKDEERRLLQGVTQVQSRLFEGKVHERSKNQEHASLEELAEEIDAYAPTEKKQRVKRENEDYCIGCRGEYGGEAVCCSHCPRTFHPQCVGLPKSLLKSRKPATCPQHKCHECDKDTQMAGGMLFRCRTCPYASCENCLPPRTEWDVVGDSIPEFRVLGASENGSAFFIICSECREVLRSQPKYLHGWEAEWARAEKQLRKLGLE